MSQERPKKDIGKSVLARLKNHAKAAGEDYNFLLTRYAIERLLYRLSISDYAKNFVLKGGTMFLAWQGKSYRVTKDLDLLGLGSADIPQIEAQFRNICALTVEDDGITFLADSVRGSEIQADTHYTGVCIHLDVSLDGGKRSMKIEIGFGDVINPKIEILDFPSLLDMPQPRLRAYPKETVIAEKFEAMVDLGIRNSRVKDFYDIWLMSLLFDFDGNSLKEAIEKTFARRKTAIPLYTPVAMTIDYYDNNVISKTYGKPSLSATKLKHLVSI